MPACAHCAASDAKFGCSACASSAHYCGPACQRAGWAAHKLDCGRIKATLAAAAGAPVPPPRPDFKPRELDPHCGACGKELAHFDAKCGGCLAVAYCGRA